MTTPKDGIYEDVPFNEYRKWDGINQSAIKKARVKSIMAMHYAMTHSSKPTKAMALGSVTHLAVLEPELYAKQPVFDGNRTAEVALAKFEAEHGKPCYTQSEHDQAEVLRDVLLQDQEAVQLLADTKHEVSMVWSSPLYGRGKMRIDMIGPNSFGDLKTMRDISKRAVNRMLFNEASGYGYGYLQWGWCREGLERLKVKNVSAMTGYILAVETTNKDLPDAYCAEIDEDVIIRGQKDAVEIAREYDACRALGNFYGVGKSDIPVFELPEWMKEEWTPEG
jgi:hypothetical protein